MTPRSPCRTKNGDVQTLASQLIGTWRLLSREDRTIEGKRQVDPGLGSDPIALLVYDSAGNFAAQFMKRDRSEIEPRAQAMAGENNSVAVGGYDAYFGTYTVDETAGAVTQRLVGSLSAGDVGRVVTRAMRVEGDRLTIQLTTTGAGGEPVIRTLVWVRAA